MQKEFDRIVNNWKVASKDLQIELKAPYTIQHNEKKIECVAFLPDFGGERGMVIHLVFHPDYITPPDFEPLCQELGLYYSSINFEAYKNYDKKLYMETLLDWGYFGDDRRKPGWL